MSFETMKSYLVSLGFKIEMEQYNKFNAAIDKQAKKITDNGKKISKTMANADGAAKASGNAYVTAFAAIAEVTTKAAIALSAVYGGLMGAIVALVDKTAQADMQYQVFAQKMFMGADAAKRFKIALDEMGYSIDEIAWNPELKKQFIELIEYQKQAEQRLGSGFKQSMVDIRAIRQEWRKFKIDFLYMGQALAANIFNKFGMNAENAREKLKQLSNWIEEKVVPVIMNDLIPALKSISEWLLNTAIPAIQEFTKELPTIATIVQTIWPSIKGLAKDMKALLNTIVIGSDQLEFKDYLIGLTGIMSGLINATVFLIRELANLGRALLYIGSGKFGQLGKVWDDAKQAWKDYNDSINKIQDAITGRAKQGQYNKLIDLVTPGAKGSSGSPISPKPVSPEIKDLLSQYFPGMEKTMAAIGQVESGWNPNAHNKAGGGAGAFGFFQIRGKLHEKGLKQAGIIDTLEDLKDPVKNFQAARWVYDKQGLSAWAESRNKWEPMVQNNDFNINITSPSGNPKEIANEVSRATVEKLKDLDRRRGQQLTRFNYGYSGVQQ
jgi:hypothetical protein